MLEKSILDSSILQISVYRSVLFGDWCYFLVSEQESNQRNRLGDVLTAKPFVTAQGNQHLRPTLSRPPPDPLQAPVDRPAVIDFSISAYYLCCSSDFRLFIYCHCFDQRRKGRAMRALPVAEKAS